MQVHFLQPTLIPEEELTLSIQEVTENLGLSIRHLRQLHTGFKCLSLRPEVPQHQRVRKNTATFANVMLAVSSFLKTQSTP